MNPQEPVQDDTQDNHYVISKRNGKTLQPLDDSLQPATPVKTNAAADLIRGKLDSLFEKEPKAKEEIVEAEAVQHRSKHQQFMYELSHSGKSLADIQTSWHNYYVNLPNNEKHEVWQEFYTNHNATKQKQHVAEAEVPAQVTHTKQPSHKVPVEDRRSIEDVKQELIGKVKTRRKLTRKDHAHSIAFGLSMGIATIFILLFGFFNERIIAPFITPSRSVSATPIIIDPSNASVGKDPKIIIPKINVEIPVDYNEPDITEATIERGLQTGAVHYPTTSYPGQVGNGVIFGHSANNILNKGQYKFAFVLLRKLEAGDMFYLQKDGKQYAYRIFDKKVVPPSDVSVLYPSFPDKPATFTLITCDPPGTSLNRMVVTAEQISPDPKANTASTAIQARSTPKVIPSNSPSLWSRITSWL